MRTLPANNLLKVGLVFSPSRLPAAFAGDEARRDVSSSAQTKNKKQNKTNVGEGGFGGAQKTSELSALISSSAEIPGDCLLTVEPPALETSHRPIRSHLKLSLVRQAVQSFVSAWANSFFGLLNRQIDEGMKVWEKKNCHSYSRSDC